MTKKKLMLPGRLHVHIRHRLGVLADLQKELVRADRSTAEIRKDLLESAPKALREWLDEEGVLSNLLTYGYAGLKIYANDETYGLGDPTAIRRKINNLRRAWKENVQIMLSTRDNDRFDITLHARVY